MIQEREMVMRREEWENEDYFPRTLILREPESEEERAGGSGNEWTGFIKDIK